MSVLVLRNQTPPFVPPWGVESGYARLIIVRERERERERKVQSCVYVYMCMCTSLLPGHVLCDICLNKLSALMRISPYAISPRL